MSRPLRTEYAGAFYQVTSRGDGSGEGSLSDQDREHFLGTLEDIVGRYRWRVHAWCLMTNHYHLLVDTAEPNLGSSMQQPNGQYAQRINQTHQRVGYFFQGRYSAIFVERDSYLLELARYVVLNPVRMHGAHGAVVAMGQELPGHCRLQKSARVAYHRPYQDTGSSASADAQGQKARFDPIKTKKQGLTLSRQGQKARFDPIKTLSRHGTPDGVPS